MPEGEWEEGGRVGGGREEGKEGGREGGREGEDMRREGSIVVKIIYQTFHVCVCSDGFKQEHFLHTNP